MMTDKEFEFYITKLNINTVLSNSGEKVLLFITDDNFIDSSVRAELNSLDEGELGPMLAYCVEHNLKVNPVSMYGNDLINSALHKLIDKLGCHMATEHVSRMSDFYLKAV